MKSLKRLALVLMMPVLFTGCAMHYNTRTLGVPVTMAEPLAQPVPGDTFRVTAKALHAFWGLATAKEPSLQQALAGQLGAGRAVHNLAIRSRKSWADILVTVVTLGVLSPTSVTFSGVVARQ